MSPDTNGNQQRSTLLLAEDTPFFRNQIKRFLDLAEYNVIAAEDGIVAWEILNERADEINLVVTDIEMPRMNGFELAKKIRSDERFENLPIVAITSLHSDEALVQGHAAGIDDWKIKLHRDEMLAAISQQLQAKKRFRVSY